MDNDNIFSIHNGGKKASGENTLPVNDYCLIDMTGEEFFGTGFLIFTSHHVAIMRDNGDGAVPVTMMPLANLKVAEIVEEEEAPF